MLLRKVSKVYYLGIRRSSSALIFILASVLGLLVVFGSLMTFRRPIAKTELSYLAKTRDLHHYLDDILDPLIESLSTICNQGQAVPLLVLVSSAPSRVCQRAAVRETWGREVPTFFFLGLENDDEDTQMVNNYMEATQYSDLIVFNCQDTYQNQTLKTALMIRWSLHRCPQAEFVLKTNDDVLVNPWTLKDVIRDHSDAKMIGYKHQRIPPIRDPYDKLYLPKWLYPQDIIPEFLDGFGYLINGDYLSKILMQAYHEPLINIEDVYYTYLVAKRGLNFHLTHDKRIHASKPFLPLNCKYFRAATMHGLTAGEMIKIWPKIKILGELYESGEETCVLYGKFESWFRLSLW